jgi:hypothetical protein
MSSILSRHRQGWDVCFRLGLAVGLLCAASRWGLVDPGAAILLIAIMAALVAASVRDDVGLAALPSIARCGLVTGLTAAAAVGLPAVFGIPGVLIVVSLIVTWPALTPSVRAAWHAVFAEPDTARPGAAPLATVTAVAPGSSNLDDTPAPLSPGDLAELDDVALCRAWRHSFTLLQAARGGAGHLAIVERRSSYLDELQRRCPDGLATWLAAGARASDNPLPYLREQRPR